MALKFMKEQIFVNNGFLKFELNIQFLVLFNRTYFLSKIV